MQSFNLVYLTFWGKKVGIKTADGTKTAGLKTTFLLTKSVLPNMLLPVFRALLCVGALLGTEGSIAKRYEEKHLNGGSFHTLNTIQKNDKAVS